MTLGRPVGHAFRHRIGFQPDDVAPQPPAIGAQGEGNHPRDSDKILGLESGWRIFITRPLVLDKTAATFRSGAVPIRRVTIAQIQPERSIIP